MPAGVKLPVMAHPTPLFQAEVFEDQQVVPGAAYSSTPARPRAPSVPLPKAPDVLHFSYPTLSQDGPCNVPDLVYRGGHAGDTWSSPEILLDPCLPMERSFTGSTDRSSEGALFFGTPDAYLHSRQHRHGEPSPGCSPDALKGLTASVTQSMLPPSPFNKNPSRKLPVPVTRSRFADHLDRERVKAGYTLSQKPPIRHSRPSLDETKLAGTSGMDADVSRLTQSVEYLNPCGTKSGVDPAAANAAAADAAAAAADAAAAGAAESTEGGLSLLDELALYDYDSETTLVAAATADDDGTCSHGAPVRPALDVLPEEFTTVEYTSQDSDEQGGSLAESTVELSQMSDSPSRSRPVVCREFSACTLSAATGNWASKNILGKGRFGTVYQGKLCGSKVAVKRLEEQTKQSKKQYEAELEVLGQVRHPQVLLLMGHCPEVGSLVYEFMPGGSLQDHLEPGNKRSLKWLERVQVLEDVASALLYLHQFDPVIVHRDLKPHNIMLDSSCRAKLGDAGLARLIGRKDEAAQAGMSGTFGYIDPDLMVTLEVVPSNDIYAFGLVCLQLLLGEPEVAAVHELVSESTSKGSHKTSLQRNVQCVLDRLDESGGTWPDDVARQLAFLGLRCMDRKQQKRPDLATCILPALSDMLASASDSDDEEDKSRDFNSQVMCPLSKVRMSDPVLAADGYTYERAAIQDWLLTQDWSPVTGEALPHKGLVPNNALKLLLSQLAKE